MTKEEEERLKLDDTEIAFFEGEGLFLADVLAEQVLLALPMKAICRSDCRGLCPQCGVNLNNEECRCESHVSRSTHGAPGASEAGLVQKTIGIQGGNAIECPKLNRGQPKEFVCPIQNGAIRTRARTSGARMTF
jgi:hypothetical protein